MAGSLNSVVSPLDTLDMDTIHQTRRATIRIAFIALVVVAFYIATVGADSAISRHMGDGRLQWMRGSSLASTVMEIYEWPARQIAVLPPMRWLFELSAAFWCGVTGAPETTA